MSAAVIGRQLRQQNTITRASGPLVAPPAYRGRPRTPSTIGRPSSPATSSTQATGPVILTSEPPFNAYHNGQLSRTKQNDPHSTLEPPKQLRCTCNCFCIALKALSVGLFLLFSGSIMSYAGYKIVTDFIESQSNKLEDFNEAQKTTLMMYKNLLYAGPCIMGLGSIVILAGLILTLEARDTLGVRN